LQRAGPIGQTLEPMLFDFEEQYIKKSFLGDFLYITPAYKILKMGLNH
jgi:hypothetical protein